MTKKLLEVGPLELEVLGLLNSHGEQSVASIQVALRGGGQDLAYTTVMTVLARLYKKGLVQRRKESRHFLYAAAGKKNASPSRIFERVKKSLFRTERLEPIMSLLESEKDLSREELEELKKAIERKLKGV